MVYDCLLLGMSMHERDRGRYVDFSTDWGSAILNVDPSHARDVILANLWIKCLQCGSNLN